MILNGSGRFSSTAMSKPSLDKAPEWANWLAMDPTGEWFWYERQPSINIEGIGRYWESWGTKQLAAESPGPWWESLDCRPDDGEIKPMQQKRKIEIGYLAPKDVHMCVKKTDPSFSYGERWRFIEIELPE